MSIESEASEVLTWAAGGATTDRVLNNISDLGVLASGVARFLDDHRLTIRFLTRAKAEAVAVDRTLMQILTPHADDAYTRVAAARKAVMRLGIQIAEARQSPLCLIKTAALYRATGAESGIKRLGDVDLLVPADESGASPVRRLLEDHEYIREPGRAYHELGDYGNAELEPLTLDVHQSIPLIRIAPNWGLTPNEAKGWETPRTSAYDITYDDVLPYMQTTAWCEGDGVMTLSPGPAAILAAVFLHRDWHMSHPERRIIVPLGDVAECGDLLINAIRNDMEAAVSFMQAVGAENAVRFSSNLIREFVGLEVPDDFPVASGRGDIDLYPQQIGWGISLPRKRTPKEILLSPAKDLGADLGSNVPTRRLLPSVVKAGPRGFAFYDFSLSGPGAICASGSDMSNIHGSVEIRQGEVVLSMTAPRRVSSGVVRRERFGIVCGQSRDESFLHYSDLLAAPESGFAREKFCWSWATSEQESVKVTYKGKLGLLSHMQEVEPCEISIIVYWARNTEEVLYGTGLEYDQLSAAGMINLKLQTPSTSEAK